MKQIIWIILILVFSVGSVLAQGNCPLIDAAFLAALDNCDDSDTGTLCYAAGDISVASDAEELDFESPADFVSLADTISLETHSDDALALIQLNREDIALRLLAIGQTQLENTAPRTTISIYALRGVNVRQEPSLESTVIGSLFQGRDYVAVGRLADNTWIQVQLDDGRIGWSSAQYFVTREGFAALEAVTPTTPPYLPMQAVRLQTKDCGGLLIMAPEVEEETIIFGINGAQIQVRGIVWVQVIDEALHISSIDGEQVVNAFGFEMPLESGEMTTIPLSESGSIAGIPSDAEESDVLPLDDEAVALLLGEG